MVRHINGCGVAASLARIASTGRTLPAFRAGASAESTVTTVPTTSGTTTASTDNPIPDCGRGMPNVFIPARITNTSPAPATTPSTEPNNPTKAASSATDRVICPRDAPNARSNANSFVRCATIMENVFAIKNVPTNRPTRPNATKKYVTKLRASRICSVVSCATFSPASIFSPGNSLRRLSTTSAAPTPSFAPTVIAGKRSS